VSGSNNAQANYRYVAEVSGTTLLSKLKCDKLPNNQGFFDVRKLARTLVVPTKPKVGFQFEDANVLRRYNVGFREEFGTPPSVASGATNASGLVQYGYDRPQDLYNSLAYYSEVASSKGIRALTERTTRRVRLNENDYLSVMFPGLGITPDVECKVTYPVRTFTFKLPLNPDTLSAIVNVGPRALNAIPSGVTSDGQPGSFGFNSVVSSYQITFDEVITNQSWANYTFMLESCQRFVPVRMLWRNKLGGIDAYEFSMKNRFVSDVQRQTFRQNTDSFGVVDLAQVWQAEFEQTWRLESDWLTQPDSSYLSELVNAPEVYIDAKTDLIPVVVQTTQYEFFQKPQDKLMRLSLTVKLAEKTAVL
jgi:hypothetical protein